MSTITIPKGLQEAFGDPARLIPIALAATLRETEKSVPPPVQKRTQTRQNWTVRIQATSSPPEKQTIRAQIRPHSGSACQRPEPPKVENPIDHFR